MTIRPFGQAQGGKMGFPESHFNGPALMARPDFQAFLAKMNLDDASIAAMETAE